MISFIISIIVTGIVLVKMIFSDIGGGNSMVDGVKEGAKQGRDIHDAITKALNDEYEEEEEEVKPKPKRKPRAKKTDTETFTP